MSVAQLDSFKKTNAGEVKTLLRIIKKQFANYEEIDNTIKHNKEFFSSIDLRLKKYLNELTPQNITRVEMDKIKNLNIFGFWRIAGKLKRYAGLITVFKFGKFLIIPFDEFFKDGRELELMKQNNKEETYNQIKSFFDYYKKHIKTYIELGEQQSKHMVSALYSRDYYEYREWFDKYTKTLRGLYKCYTILRKKY